VLGRWMVSCSRVRAAANGHHHAHKWLVKRANTTVCYALYFLPHCLQARLSLSGTDVLPSPLLLAFCLSACRPLCGLQPGLRRDGVGGRAGADSGGRAGRCATLGE